MWQKIKPYIIFVGSALAVGGLSALVTGNSMDNYARPVSYTHLTLPTILLV